MSYRYLLFNKPYGVLSQFSGGSSERSTLQAFIPIQGVYPVGRLDRDSEGLMLLTDHGRIQHRLSDPKFGHPRTYWAQVEHIPTEAALKQLASGLEIQNYQTRPAQVKRLTTDVKFPPRNPPIRDRKSVPTAWIELTLTEGKNRQVRRMTAAIGHPTLRLVRVAIAHLCLAGLPPGQWRDLNPSEQRQLLKL
ncbi:pseudouridine synthase [filamentous cyanobacterium CCP5]|nr:pseudouridine synthase [filamentous cyanobacterium CCP5]